MKITKPKINLEDLTDKEFEMYLAGVKHGSTHIMKTTIMLFVVAIILLIIFK